MCTGGGNRTPVGGFGDHSPAIKRHPLIRSYFNTEQPKR